MRSSSHDSKHKGDASGGYGADKKSNMAYYLNEDDPIMSGVYLGTETNKRRSEIYSKPTRKRSGIYSNPTENRSEMFSNPTEKRSEIHPKPLDSYATARDRYFRHMTKYGAHNTVPLTKVFVLQNTTMTPRGASFNRMTQRTAENLKENLISLASIFGRAIRRHENKPSEDEGIKERNTSRAETHHDRTKVRTNKMNNKFEENLKYLEDDFNPDEADQEKSSSSVKSLNDETDHAHAEQKSDRIMHILGARGSPITNNPARITVSFFVTLKRSTKTFFEGLNFLYLLLGRCVEDVRLMRNRPSLSGNPVFSKQIYRL